MTHARQIPRQGTPSPSLEQEVVLGLQVAAHRALDGWARELQRREGLTPNQYSVLLILRGGHPRGLSCREIADRMVTRDPDVTRLLDRLVRKGLAQRTRGAADRRIVTVGVTRDGLALLARLDAVADALPARNLGGLGERRLRQLRDLLDLAITEFSRDAEPGPAGSAPQPD